MIKSISQLSQFFMWLFKTGEEKVMLLDKRGAEGKFAMVSREPRLLFSPNLAGTARGGNREKKRKREMLQQLFSKFQHVLIFFYIFEYFSARRGSREKKRNTAATFQRPKIIIIKHRLKNVCHTVYILIINNPFGSRKIRLKSEEHPIV